MHPSRRRKKRPNYGIKTVEVMRGPNGFGFTISGQQPCILSCIVANSPADQAGLRAGDFLISVNGISVSKITHDAVVNLIGNCVGPIQMTIAENYYSDSSDEELGVARITNTRKPKYMHKPRRLGKENTRRAVLDRMHDNSKLCFAGRDMKNCFKDPKVVGNIYKEHHAQNETLNTSNPIAMDDEAGPIEYKVLIGYLGTIEMPKQLLPNTRLQTVCTCIRKLRQEKRVPTAVLMTVLPTCLTLKNSSNNILAIYPTNRVAYIGSATDKDSRYFGLVTSAVCDSRSNEPPQKPSEVEKKFNNTESEIEVSNSCHVFVTDPKIVDHSIHIKKAESFRFTCTQDPITGNCLEFPPNALYIVNLVQTMYKLQNDTKPPNRPEGMNFGPVLANSPQPSASSNSDSGIGFRDDCGNISDRILIVEFPVKRVIPIINPCKSSVNNRPVGIDAFNIPLESLDLPLNNAKEQNLPSNSTRLTNNVDFSLPNNLSDNDKLIDNHLNNLNNIRACESISIKNVLNKPENFNKQEYLAKQNNDVETPYHNNNNNLDTYERLNCRALPDREPKVSKVTRGISSASTSSEDNTHTSNGDIELPTEQKYNERPVDVPESELYKKSCETSSLQSVSEDLDFKSSTDNISMHSSKSSDFNNTKSVFKTPKAKIFENKKSTKHLLKLTSSCDGLDKYNANVMDYKLSPKVYGLSKPNYSCEELNNLDLLEKFGYGSLQDLSSWNPENTSKRHIAQSEPDVRMQRNGLPLNLMCDQNGHSKCGAAEGPSAWATSFEKLLEDPLGLHTFAEFLKKEFSAENIYFWTACERYRRFPPGAERQEEAQRIYQRHLCVGAPEPINVDSHGRQCTAQSLQEADSTLFDQAQKQIFNLMKFDSYPRFLKSSIYKECLAGLMNKPEFDISLMIQPSNLTPSKLKKSLSNAEDRRRKSLLPWHRKNRSKSKDRGESEYIHRFSNRPEKDDTDAKKNRPTDIHSSRSSLTSLDLAVTNQESIHGSQDELSMVSRTALCRVILSNGSTTVVQIKESETIHQLVRRLLEKRGLTYSSFEVCTDKHPKAIDVNESSTRLAGCEVTVEQRVIFKLDLPNRKVISVKSKYTKIIVDVLRPILHKYSFNLDQVRVTKGGTNEPINMNQPVTFIDNMRLNIQLRDDIQNHVSSNNNNNNQHITISNTKPNKLDEITNQVFEGILQEKADSALSRPKSDKGSVKSEDWGSEHSSGIFGRFLRRDSALHEKKKKSLIPRSKTTLGNEDFGSEQSQIKKPLIAKWKAGVNKLQVACSESDELVEGLTRAQRSRLEDQRGTEINFELPDFLKDKESDQNLQKPPRCLNGKENSHFYIGDAAHLASAERIPAISSAKNLKLELQANNYENTFINPNNLTPVTIQSENKLNNLRIYSPNKFPLSHNSRSNNSTPSKSCYSPSSSNQSPRSNQSTPSKSSSLENTVIEVTPQHSRHCEPPPLPPKPKIIPIKPSNWGHNGFYKPRGLVVGNQNKSEIFLEQTSSSFV